MFSEIDDIRHRHSTYWDVYNNYGWVDPPDQGIGWNVLRGLAVGGPAAYLGELCAFYFKQYKLIRTRYDPPESLAQVTSYLRLAGSLENARWEWRVRRQAAVLHAADWAQRLLGYKLLVSGISQMYAAPNREYWRRVLPTMFGALLTSTFIAPIQAAKAALRADQTFPPALRAGYTGLFHALYRLARENPLLLCRDTLPFVFGSYIQTSFLLAVFEFNMEYFSPVYADSVGGSRNMLKLVVAGFAAFAASAFSFPVLVSVRNAVHLLPAQISEGRFHGSYRKAFWYYWTAELWSQAWTGYFRSGFFLKSFPTLFAVAWLADSFGYFKGPRADFTRLPGSNSYGTFHF